MVCDESRNLLREENHSEHNYDASPKQQLPHKPAFHRAKPCATLLPESKTEKHDRQRKEPGPELQHKSAGTGGSDGRGEA
jgi:hypothetical protein